jgi:hypothetical protein
MFSSFDGVWAARHVSRRQEFDSVFKTEVWRYYSCITIIDTIIHNITAYTLTTPIYSIFYDNDIYRYKTKLTYSVLVRPRGPVPVFALEWRIKEDVPVCVCVCVCMCV